MASEKTTLPEIDTDPVTNARKADVCFLMEGTYPFVQGGVSTWTHHLIKSFPDRTFAILHLSPTRNTYDEYRYEVPDNVLHIQEEYLFERASFTERKRPSDVIRRFTSTADMDPGSIYRKLYRREWDVLPDLVEWIREGRMTLDRILNSHRSYQTIKQMYEEKDLEVSFMKFFWNSRFLLSPLITLLKIDVPPADMYHSVSTGYGGLLGVITRIGTGRPFLLTEHGLYAREREIEINRSSWLQDRRPVDFHLDEGENYFQKNWIQFFYDLAELIYSHADGCLSISRRNRAFQKQHGADPDALKLIPNGINPDEFPVNGDPPAFEDPEEPFRIAFIGRVAPMKDLRTFIQSVKILVDRDMNLVAHITGYTDEEPAYAERCRNLRRMLDLQDTLKFVGPQPIPDYFDEIDLVVLTSIKEVQPMIIIEAAGAGVPVVATKVGSCEELLEGRTEEDRAIGRAGLLTDPSSPEQTADAVQRLSNSPALYRTFSRNGRERVERFYNWTELKSEYDSVYRHFRGEGPWPALGSI